MGQGKRIDRVEDVFELGQPVEVKVDDIDPQGKVSLSLAGEAPASSGSGSSGGGGGGRGDRGDRGDRGGSSRGDHSDPGNEDHTPRRQQEAAAPAGAASFEDSFEQELVQEFGDLGPAAAESSDRPSSGGGGLPYNPSMHQIGAVGRFFNVGANYKF